MSFQAMTWAVEQELPTNQKMVLLMLANRTNHDTGRCDPSHRRLAKDCGMSVSTLKRALTALEEAGYITVIPRSVNGVNLPNQYRLNMNGVGSERTDPSSERPEGWGQNELQTSNNNQEENQEVEVLRARPKKTKAPKPEFNPETGRIENIPESAIAKWQEAYPAVDVKLEIAKAEAWLLANPSNRKNNYVRFLNNWLSRAQDRAPRVQHVSAVQSSGRPRPKHTGLEDKRLGEGLKADPNNPFLYDF